MAQVHISDWVPSPRSSIFDPSIPRYDPELDFNPNIDTRMKSPSPFDATMFPTPPPPSPPLPKFDPEKHLQIMKAPKTPPKKTRKGIQKIVRLGATTQMSTRGTRRASPTKVTPKSDQSHRRARIYNSSSPHSITGSSLRVAGDLIADSPERLALLTAMRISPGSLRSSRLSSSPYYSPTKRGKAGSGMGGHKKLTSSPSAKASLGLVAGMFGSLKRLKTVKAPSRQKDSADEDAKTIWGGSWAGKKKSESRAGSMEVDSPRGGTPAGETEESASKFRGPIPPFDPSSMTFFSSSSCPSLPVTSSSSATSTFPSSSTSTPFSSALTLAKLEAALACRRPKAITSADDVDILDADLEQLHFDTRKKAMLSPNTGMGSLSLEDSSSSPDVTSTTSTAAGASTMAATKTTSEVGVQADYTNPYEAYRDALGSRSVETLPLPDFAGWGDEPVRTWSGSTAVSSSYIHHAPPSVDKNFDFDMTPSLSHSESTSTSPSSLRRERSRFNYKVPKRIGDKADGGASTFLDLSTDTMRKGASSRKGDGSAGPASASPRKAKCASYKEARDKEFERRRAEFYEQWKGCTLMEGAFEAEMAVEMRKRRHSKKARKGRVSNE